MSATDELRRLLDERGVEWDALQDDEGDEMTRWLDSAGRCVTALDYGETQHFTDFYWQPTAQQAIEATLGRGECRKLPASGDSVCIVRRHGYEMEFGYWRCSECGCECFEGARYCMGCGRKVVDA